LTKNSRRIGLRISNLQVPRPPLAYSHD
jgi:hypothetical protein